MNWGIALRHIEDGTIDEFEATGEASADRERDDFEVGDGSDSEERDAREWKPEDDSDNGSGSNDDDKPPPSTQPRIVASQRQGGSK